MDAWRDQVVSTGWVVVFWGAGQLIVSPSNHNRNGNRNTQRTC